MALSELDKGLNQLPLLWKAISLVGLPVVLCLIFVAKDMALQFGWVENQRERQYQALYKSHNQLLNVVVENRASLYRQEDLSLAICLNVATNEEAKRRCRDAIKKSLTNRQGGIP